MELTKIYIHIILEIYSFSSQRMQAHKHILLLSWTLEIRLMGRRDETECLCNRKNKNHMEHIFDVWHDWHIACKQDVLIAFTSLSPCLEVGAYSCIMLRLWALAAMRREISLPKQGKQLMTALYVRSHRYAVVRLPSRFTRSCGFHPLFCRQSSFNWFLLVPRYSTCTKTDYMITSCAWLVGQRASQKRPPELEYKNIWNNFNNFIVPFCSTSFSIYSHNSAIYKIVPF